MRGPLRLFSVFAAALAAIAAPALAQTRQTQADASRAGDITAEPATPGAVAVRWPVVGDRNRNATISVAYRAVGRESWRAGYPLFRASNDRLSPDNRVSGGHLFAGSIFDLEPDTPYEVELTLEDPDGGSLVRTIQLRTARLPHEPGDMRRRFAVPLAPGQTAGGTGTENDPFRGFRAAQAQAQPGDLIILAPGLYAEGPVALRMSGTAERPIIYRGPAEGEAVLDGQGRDVLIDASRREYVWFDRLTFQNAAALLRADGAKDIVVRRNRFLVKDRGFTARGAIYKEATGFHISDNTFIGTTQWPRSKGIEQVYAINITGAGHVVSHNLIRNFGDGVHNGDEGRLSASDIHNNEIDVCTDDGIEVDYSDTNVRVFRNRITNCFSGISGQPVHGGPVYVFRNVLYNLLYSPFKLHNDTAGLLIFHNTSVMSGIPFHIQPATETVSDVVTRNNIFVGTLAPALRSTGQMIRCDFDSDGYRWGSGDFALWNRKSYASAAAARASGELYAHRGAVTLGPKRVFATNLSPPEHPEQAAPPASNDPRLAAGSRAIDGAVELPNFNDRHAGKAPDLGCCEFGEPLPRFGPRREELDR